MRLLRDSNSQSMLEEDLLKPSEIREPKDESTGITERSKLAIFSRSSFTSEERREGDEGATRELLRCKTESDNGASRGRRPFWLNCSDNRNENACCGESVEFVGGDSLEKVDSQVDKNRNNCSRNHSTKTVVQKWEKIIRASHGVESFGKRIEVDGTDEIFFSSPKVQSVGVLKSNSASPKGRRVRRSFGLGDITNNTNPISPRFSDTHESIFFTPSRRSVGNGIINCSNQLEDSKISRVYDANEENSVLTRATRTDPVGLSVTVKPARTRRSFGLGDFVDSSNPPPVDFSEQRSTATDSSILKDISTGSELKSGDLRRGKINCSDSDDSEFKNLLDLWNNQKGDNQIHLCSPRKSPKSPPKFHGVDGEDNLLKVNLNGSKNTRLNANSSKTDTLSFDTPISDSLVQSDHPKESAPTTNKKTMRAIVILEQQNKFDLVVGEVRANEEVGNQLVIQNLSLETNGTECKCSNSAFSGNEDLICFFLPQMGMACNCGGNRNALVNPNDPTAIENIFRPWQVEFLKSVGIHRGEQLVKARHRSNGIMARGLRQWRKKHGMVSFKTNSCETALLVWSKVCKSYVRSIRRQVSAGEEDFRFAADAASCDEISQFLVNLPTAPKRRDRSLNDVLGIEPESQVEI